jgi:Ca2+-binding RTX toxin-like protein
VSQVLQTPAKLGIGGYQSFGVLRLLADIGLLDAAWFYTWSSALPPVAADPWTLGDDVALGGTALDRSLKLGASSDAWLLQDVPVTAGQSFTLSVETAGTAADTGGLSVEFRDAAGTRLSSHWMALDGTQGRVTLAGLPAPAGAVSARIVAWGSSGALELDDVTLTSDAGGGNLVWASGFESAMADPAHSSAVPFVPMVWGATAAGGVDTTGLAGEPVVLGFNEPDLRAQSNLTVAQAIALWPDLMATGARLGSPAVATSHTLGSTSWLGKFMAQASAAGLRVDFIAVHYYSTNPDVAAFKTWLTKVYNAYHLPIWVTEWGLVDFTNPDRFTSTETAKFFTDGTLMMDGLGFVEKHAWFGLYDGLDGLNVHTHLLDDAGQLTPVGQAFAAFSPVRDLTGTAGDDLLRGGANGDRFNGGDGADTLVAGLGDDSLTGGTGPDRFDLGSVDRMNLGQDRVTDFDFAGSDADTLVFTFRGSDRTLSTAADFAALAAELAADSDPVSALTLAGADMVIDFGTGLGQVVLEGAATDAGVAAAFAPAPVPQVIAEYGSVSVSHRKLAVTLTHSFVDPVVILTVTSQTEATPVVSRLSAVTGTGFTLFLDEPNAADGRHAYESVSWMVVESGHWTTTSGMEIEAGRLQSSLLSSKGTTPTVYSGAFAAAPMVFTTGQTSAGSDALWTRAAAVTGTGFEAVLQEEESLNSGTHATETIGWLAVSRGSGLIDGATLVDTSAAGAAASSQPGAIAFAPAFAAAPVLLAGMASTAEPDPAGLRLGGLGAGGATVFVQEDTSFDAETAHGAERIDWLALVGSGTLSGFDSALLG